MAIAAALVLAGALAPLAYATVLVDLRWRTAGGARILGVNVFRGGKRLNARLLPASGRLLDRHALRSVPLQYHLQAVAPDGARRWLWAPAAR